MQQLAPPPVKERIEVIPQERIIELNAFLTRIANLQIYRPNARPKSSWRMFYARRIEDAEDVAFLTAVATENGKKASSVWKEATLSREAAGGVFMGEHGAYDAALMAGWNATVAAAKKAGRERTVKDAQESRFGSGDQFGFTVGLMAGLILVKDLNFDGKERYLKHAAERMEVWEKGYGLAGDVNGVLYVYAQAELGPEKHLRGRKSSP